MGGTAGAARALRQVVCAGPRRGVFDVVVAGHVLGGDGDFVAGLPRQQQGGGEAGDSCALRVRFVAVRGAEDLPNNDNVLLFHFAGCIQRNSMFYQHVLLQM